MSPERITVTRQLTPEEQGFALPVMAGVFAISIIARGEYPALSPLFMYLQIISEVIVPLIGLNPSLAVLCVISAPLRFGLLKRFCCFSC